MKKIIALAIGSLFASIAMAKLPPPSVEAAAKAEETKDKAAWAGKVAGYTLCLAQDKTAAYYVKSKAPANKPMEGLPACADPGPYVAVKVVAKVDVAPAVALNKEPVKK